MSNELLQDIWVFIHCIEIFHAGAGMHWRYRSLLPFQGILRKQSRLFFYSFDPAAKSHLSQLVQYLHDGCSIHLLSYTFNIILCQGASSGQTHLHYPGHFLYPGRNDDPAAGAAGSRCFLPCAVDKGWLYKEIIVPLRSCHRIASCRLFPVQSLVRNTAHISRKI